MDPLDLLAIGQMGGGEAAAAPSIMDMLKAARPSPEQAKRMDAIQRISGALEAPVQAPQPASVTPATHAAPVAPQVAPVQGGQFPMAAPPPRRAGGLMALGAMRMPIPGTAGDVMQNANAAMLGAMDRGNYGHAAQMGALGADYATRMGLR